MKFIVKINTGDTIVADYLNSVILRYVDWNDYGFNTLYRVTYIDGKGRPQKIGDVRIGRVGQASEDIRQLKEDTVFNKLDDNFFSLGTSLDFYEKLESIGTSFRIQVLEGLNDIAFSSEIYEKAIQEGVTKISLLRGFDERTVKGQLRRVAHGGTRLKKYHFFYDAPNIKSDSGNGHLSFKITPESNPPSNIHVLIGRNGVGKTSFLNSILSNLSGNSLNNSTRIYFGGLEPEEFVNVVSVSFSAFDDAMPYFDSYSDVTGISFKYIGLKKRDDRATYGFKIKDLEDLETEFVDSILECIGSFKKEKLKKGLVALQSDPIFREIEISELLDLSEELIKEKGTATFKKLSSGHKIILLSISRLVETVQEKSLVLIDEPEAHLHPPLLSSFIRALSELLTDMNGVAIIATHSPVIVQEVSRDCTYKFRRSGNLRICERPQIETFGENVGVLTREIFELEVLDSGFYKIISNAVTNSGSYEELLIDFEEGLGSEARSIAKVLFNHKGQQG